MKVKKHTPEVKIPDRWKPYVDRKELGAKRARTLAVRAQWNKERNDNDIRIVNLYELGIHKNDLVYKKLDEVETFFYTYLYRHDSLSNLINPITLKGIKRLRNRIYHRAIGEQEYSFLANSTVKEIIKELDGWYKHNKEFLDARETYVLKEKRSATHK